MVVKNPFGKNPVPMLMFPMKAMRSSPSEDMRCQPGLDLVRGWRP